MILSINSGSSSVKAAFFNAETFTRIISLNIVGIGDPKPKLSINNLILEVEAENHQQALKQILDYVFARSFEPKDVSAVGHRVVHGGEMLITPTLIDDTVEQTIESSINLAPLHNPMCLNAVRIARRMLNHCPHIAIFDTAFHSTLPDRAKLYALPKELVSKHRIRRFGFHGISHEYVSKVAAKSVGKPLKELRVISCHLGNGCSVTAVENGRSVETSMGMTPLEGLMMGSRCGDLDAGVLIRILRNESKSADELDYLLNHKSGLLGMTGTNDMYEIEKRASSGDDACRQAIEIFAHRVLKYIGAYVAVMGGIDIIVFTGGIGENSPAIRQRISQSLSFLGATLNQEHNLKAKVGRHTPVALISTDSSATKLLVVATDEEVAIAKMVQATLDDSPGKSVPLSRAVPSGFMQRNGGRTTAKLAKP